MVHDVTSIPELYRYNERYLSTKGFLVAHKVEHRYALYAKAQAVANFQLG